MKKTAAAGRERYLADFSLLLTTAVWGLTFTVLKSILGNQVSSIFFIAMRFAIAALVLYPFCRRKLRDLGKGGFLGGVVLGILLFTGFATQSLGIEITTASKAAFITGLSAIFVPMFLFMHKRKLPSLINGGAIVAALAGMYLLTDPAGGSFNRGDILVLICAVIFGAQIYVMEIVTQGRNATALTFVELATTAVLAVLFLPLENVQFELSLKFVILIFLMGSVATAGALLVQTWAQKKTSAVKVGLILTAEPVFAYMFASAILDDYFNPTQKIGGAIIIAAVLASEIVPLLMSRRAKI